MENPPTFIAVVAAAIHDARGRLLLQRALPHKRHGGQWELPGGKVESQESPRLALCREIAEELGLELDPEALQPAGFAEEPGEDGRPGLVLLLYTCTRWTGEPVPHEGQEWGWHPPAEAISLELAPMDRALLSALLR